MAAGRPGRPPKEWQNQIPLGFFDDAGVCELDGLERLLLLGLIGKADRSGRGSAKPSKLRAELLDGLPVTDDQVAGMLERLPQHLAGSLYEFRLYVVDRNLYYWFPRWREYQTMDYVPVSRFPAPSVGGADEQQGSQPTAATGMPTPGAGRSTVSGHADSATGMPTPGAEQGAVPQTDARAAGIATPGAGQEPAGDVDWATWYERKHAMTLTRSDLQLFDELRNAGMADALIVEHIKVAIKKGGRSPLRLAKALLNNLVPYGIRTVEEWQRHQQPPEASQDTRSPPGREEEDPRDRIRHTLARYAPHAATQ